MVWTGPLHPLHPLPPSLDYRPELTDDDIEWLNKQLELVDDPDVRFDNKLPAPPPTSWIKMTKVRG